MEFCVPAKAGSHGRVRLNGAIGLAKRGPGFRWDNDLRDDSLEHVVPAQGEAGIPARMRGLPARFQRRFLPNAATGPAATGLRFSANVDGTAVPLINSPR